MPELTPRLGIKKPLGNETVTRESFNDNWDIIDAAVATRADIKAFSPARFVIGTSGAGWTTSAVDYLCDGVDDQVEINNAIQALPANGGEIVILDGTYNITAKINVNKSNVSIRGNGNSTVLKRMWDSAEVEGVITLTSVEGCSIKNLQIYGNTASYTSYNKKGIYLSHSSGNTVADNTCSYNTGGGIYLVSSNDNIITGNNCKNNKSTGIYLSTGAENTITDNTCSYNTGGGIYLTSNNNSIITGNICCHNSSNGIQLDSCTNNTIIGNICDYNLQEDGIMLMGSSGNTITGNTCNNQEDGIGLMGSSGNTITGNTCNNNDFCGIALSYGSERNTITGNTCIRGTGESTDYTSNQFTIILFNMTVAPTNYNLISSNNCMGKAVVIEGGTSNTNVNNKYS